MNTKTNTKMDTMVMDAELSEIVGGKHKNDEKSLGKKKDMYCLQCEITGRSMTQYLYKKNGLVYCPLCGTEYPGLD